MSTLFRLVSILCLINAVAVLFFNTYFPLNPAGVQPLWDYVVDPLTLVVLVLVVGLNVRASLQTTGAEPVRSQGPVDVFTMVTAFVGIIYLHNYVLKFSDHFEASATIWNLFAPAVIVITGVSAISFWRRADRA